MQVVTIRLDPAKNVFPVHGFAADGTVAVRRRLSRACARKVTRSPTRNSPARRFWRTHAHINPFGQYRFDVERMRRARCALAQLLRDRRGVAAHAEALSTLAVEQGFALFSAVGAVFRGWVAVEGGEVAAGVARMREGLAAYQGTGAAAHEPYFLGLIAEAHRQAGDAGGGQELLAEARERVVRMDTR